MREAGAAIDLLRACGRRDLDDASRERADVAARAVVDWQAAIAIAARHGLLPLLQRHAAAGVPIGGDDAGRLRRLGRLNTAWALNLAGELSELLAIGADHRVPVVPLKGPLLSQTLYGSVALRQMRDLDILVPPADMATMSALLLARGYRLDEESERLLDAQASAASHHLTFIGREGLKVELHYYLLRPRGRGRWTFDTLRPLLRPSQFLGRPAQVLEDEALLVYLCEHGAEHAWSRLEWVAAVAQLLRDGRIRNWARVDAAARLFDAAARVRAGVALAAGMFDGVPPPTCSAPRVFHTAANAIVTRRLRLEPTRISGTPFEHLGYLLLTDTGWGRRARRLVTALLAPNLADAHRRPAARAWRWLHAASRPLRRLRRQLVPQPVEPLWFNRDRDRRSVAGLFGQIRP